MILCPKCKLKKAYVKDQVIKCYYCSNIMTREQYKIAIENLEKKFMTKENDNCMKQALKLASCEFRADL